MITAISIAAAGIGFLVGLGIGQAVDWWLDRRRDAIRAARTAATLAQLHREDHP